MSEKYITRKSFINLECSSYSNSNSLKLLEPPCPQFIANFCSQANESNIYLTVGISLFIVLAIAIFLILYMQKKILTRPIRRKNEETTSEIKMAVYIDKDQGDASQLMENKESLLMPNTNITSNFDSLQYIDSSYSEDDIEKTKEDFFR